MADPIDLDALPCLPIAYAVDGECIVLDHHDGEVEVRDPEDLVTETTPWSVEADWTSRGLTQPDVVPQLPVEPE